MTDPTVLDLLRELTEYCREAQVAHACSRRLLVKLCKTLGATPAYDLATIDSADIVATLDSTTPGRGYLAELASEAAARLRSAVASGPPTVTLEKLLATALAIGVATADKASQPPAPSGEI